MWWWSPTSSRTRRGRSTAPGWGAWPCRSCRPLSSLAEAQRRNRERGLWVAPARVAAPYPQQFAFASAGETLDTAALPAAAAAARLAPLIEAPAVGGAPAR